VASRPITGATIKGARGMAYDPAGRRWLVLDGARQRIVFLRAHGATMRASNGPSLARLGSGDLRGIALDVTGQRIYVGDQQRSRIYALTRGGHQRGVLDVSDVNATSLRSLAFGPTADPTDGKAVSSLYATDAGSASSFGRVAEVSLSALGTGVAAAATTSTATLVRRSLLSTLSPPSPDPSGIVYMSDQDRLQVVDSEVDEMSIFQNVNMWQISRDRSTTFATGNTLKFSNEPTGVGYDPSRKRMFISDDNKKRVFEITAGPDNRFGTADDPVTSFSTSAFGDTDPEDVTYDTVSGDLFVTDGVGLEVWRVSDGANNRFDGIAPTGDDTVSHFDVGVFGNTDLEGIGYSPTRDSLFLADRKFTKVNEVTKTGALVQSIDVAGIGMNNPASITLAPATNDPTRTDMYITIRGVDNDNHPTENDGAMYELSAPDLGPVGQPTNTAPVVSAGADQTVTLPASASLDGTVTDDGRPNPPGAVTTTWTRVSGPGTVTFGNASAVDTTASFSAAGTYVLRLTASDGALTSADDVTVTVLPAGGGGTQTVEVRVSASSDDAEQRGSSSTNLTSTDLELTTDGTVVQVVGIRFRGVSVPAGATITNAYLQFQTDEVSTGASSLTLRAENADNTPTYTAAANNVTSRATTAASVAWSPPDWATVGQAGLGQRTPNLSALVQAVVSRAGWAPGNAMALQVSGTGRRTAEAFDGVAAAAPLLHIEYTTG
jgi:hypothetical protein